MAKRKAAAPEQIDPTSTEFVPLTPEPEPEYTPPEEKKFADESMKKPKYERPVDPFGFENIKTDQNLVRLLKSEGHRAWVIRFAHNPNDDKGPNGETYSKENPSPVLKMLKSEGYRWGFDNGDGQGGWGKKWSGDPYGADHIEARRVLAQAAELIGMPKEKEIAF
jgi:hypothetical protein